ncbi:hypothetical protein ONS95_014460 [Cadophora gregata]|uniref:uncharacterized protein n=1 Tax=Cadophora gregata TaxID=51156 RepID=UPI0026DD4C8B|nr:uncharacterized protein ONS95_014460 [Cadophora gregata]KAK0112724.1 hypothetical protein ONS95_014460 [Cadophora gregata]KAK0124858.1 hypothetical protein ONS96_008737 [Cadophora gregata f. sp. sojae]
MTLADLQRQDFTTAKKQELPLREASMIHLYLWRKAMLHYYPHKSTYRQIMIRSYSWPASYWKPHFNPHRKAWPASPSTSTYQIFDSPGGSLTISSPSHLYPPTPTPPTF